ncbi:uncharacterized protein FIBRA_01033 [Fibroporia radiculosa]|uniref:P-loop containing nucleoside triphosphate hydrolase protein n=1 Tax=Fibroporia radiculosa TaxID=599839 RepID=J4H0V8_9APHY|nr:uncharacterized protein FIBRA_01033 [Fibroporia radiculosa]CCL99024.1 predicted protein [Fibroporia radiculosa]
MPWFLHNAARGLRLYSTVIPQVVLRPYQESCLAACLDALKSGSSRIGVSLPTGSGKTTVFLSLLSRILPPAKNPSARRSLIVVNSVELARQAAAQAEKLFPTWSIEIEQGAKYHASGLADITVATYQTLLRPQRLAKFDPHTLKAVIIDEAHHAAAPSYRRILSHFDAAIRSPDSTFDPPALPHSIPILGFSATFSRHDGLALGSVFERIVYHRDFLEMIKEQWLCNVRFTSVQANIDLSEVTVNARTGDFNPTSLAHVINTDTVNRLVVQTWLDKAGTRKSTLVFCVNLAHVRELTNAFRDAGMDARYVYSGTPVAERKILVESFRAGQFPILVNCAVLTEGTDIPNIDCVLVARPTRSRNIFAQMIGRGMRLSPSTGKEDCQIIDFVDSTNRVPGVISTPTLFGLDPSELIDGDTTQSLEQRALKLLGDDGGKPKRSDSKSVIPDPKSVTYVDYDNPFALVDDAGGAPHVRKLSSNAWVGCGDDVYILECMGKGYIRIEPVKADEGKAHFTPANLSMVTAFTLKLSPYQRSRQILTAPTLVEAIRGADTYAVSKIVKGSLVMGLLRSAHWRREPATESQKKWIEKRRTGRRSTSTSEKLHTQGRDASGKINTLTKGEAANIITRLKHGAQARYKRKIKEELKKAENLAKEMRRRVREEVQVGPLSILE